MTPARLRGCSRLARVGMAACALAAAFAPPAQTAPATAASAPAAATADAAPDSGTTLSLSARKVYEQARSQLVQIRTVLKLSLIHI